MSRLTVVMIEHKYGVTVEVCDNNKTAAAVLRDWVRKWWCTEMNEHIPGKITDKHVAQYFGDTQESYIISQVEGITTMETLRNG